MNKEKEAMMKDLILLKRAILYNLLNFLKHQKKKTFVPHYKENLNNPKEIKQWLDTNIRSILRALYLRDERIVSEVINYREIMPDMIKKSEIGNTFKPKLKNGINYWNEMLSIYDSIFENKEIDLANIKKRIRKLKRDLLAEKLIQEFNRSQFNN